MPFYLYVYAPSDFVGGLPAESGAQAAGTGPFTLELLPGATGTRIVVDDNESIFDEVDSTQTLDTTVTIGSNTYPAGTTVHSAYDLINTGTGHKVTSLHFGGTGYQQGAVHGLVSSVPLTPGVPYTFNLERTSHQQNNQYDDYVACFASGSLIKTDRGLVDIAEIQAGDLVVTQERGLQPVLWTGQSRVVGKGALAPIRFSAGALGTFQDLWLSPNHRVLQQSAVVEFYFGFDRAMVAAKHLVNGSSIQRVECAEVTYHHILTSAHDIVFANGAPVETLYLGAEGKRAITAAAERELRMLFPELFQQTAQMELICPCLRGFEAKLLAEAAF